MLRKTKRAMKKVANVRKCVVTGERRNKDELIRVVRIDGMAKIDLIGNTNGRGAYITPQIKVIEKAQKKNVFARALKMKVEEQVYLDLLDWVEK